MSFAVFTDGCSNLPGELLQRLKIRILPCTYTVQGQSVTYSGDVESFPSHEFYEQLRQGAEIRTSLINTQQFYDHFRPALEAGEDLVYVGLSSGVSGTLQAANIAAEELAEEFPQRQIRVIDSLGAGLGTGWLACRAADLREAGKSAVEAASVLLKERMQLCQFFTVEDLQFLHRSGRISASTYALGKVLDIKPLLRGDEEGHIVSSEKHRGRKRAINALVEKYSQKVRDAANNRVFISHGDCPEEAQSLADRIRQIAQPKELFVVPHEPFTGCHVGPGMLGLFFLGDHR